MVYDIDGNEIASGNGGVSELYGKQIINWQSNSCIRALSSLEASDAEGSIIAASSALIASDYECIETIPGMILELPMPKVSDTTQVLFGIHFYDKDKQALPGRGCACPFGRTSGDVGYAVMRFYIDSRTKYFRTTYWSEADRQSLNAPEFSYNIVFPSQSERRITNELPVSVDMQNSIRRARQLTDIKWTPRVKIPRYSMMNGSSQHFLDWFNADTEYTGIPYSGAGGGDGNDWTTPKEWGYAHNWLGGVVDFETFVTAARYPNSIMGSKASQASDSYDSSPFGSVCTALVNYAVNGSWPLRSISGFFNVSGFFKLSTSTLGSLDVNKLAIGDFLYTSAHVIMITDLLRDREGNVTHVEMSEETTVGNGNNSILGSKFGGVARRKMWPVSTWQTMYAAYTVYRRPSFYGIPYTPSRYVNTGNEGDGTNIVDLPCIPYMGNKFRYKVGYIPNSKVLIGATGFTGLTVLKDGATFGTFDVTGLDEISVGFSAAGSYSAYLTKGNVKTMSCEWTVE